MANLQDQLGLGLAAKQASKQANPTAGYSYTYQNPISNTKNIAVGVPLPGQMSTGGGVTYGQEPQVTKQAITPVAQSIQSLGASTTPTSIAGGVSKIGDIAGVPNKKNRNIAESTGQVAPTSPTGVMPSPVSPDLSGFREATAGQDVQFRSSYRKALQGQGATPTTPEMSPTGLSGAELQAYNMLSPQEQAQYKALATQGLKAQTDYLTKSKANTEFQKSQEEKRLEMEDNADAIAEIASQRTIEDAQKQVANLKQNIGYLGTGGQPGVSSQKLDAVSNQVTLADRTLKNIIEVERLQKENRQLGQEKNAEIFTRQLKILQDDLDSKVNQKVQSALNEFSAAELEGKLDTIPEIEAFQQQLYAQLDGDLSSIMDTNIEARQFLIERYDKLAESQKAQMANTEKAIADYQKNANTLNKDMSEALGYFVNNNGEPLVDKTTGQQIAVPPETTTNYDASTGQLILLTKNRDGTVGVQLKQVGNGKATTPEWKQDANGNWYNANSPVNPVLQTSVGGATGDLRSLAPQFPGQAWAKNNNPAGISWNANFDKGTGTAALLNQAGIQYSKGTPRPANEGGNYVTFNTIEDGLKAQQIIMTQTYGNSTVGQMLGSWVGTSEAPNYAKQVAGMAGVDVNTPVSQLSPDQLSTLQMAKIQKESPGLAKLLQGGQPAQQGYTEENKIFDALFNFSGGAAKVSEAEMKLMKERAKTFTQLGLTPTQAIAKYKGFDIAKPEDAELAQNYISIGDNLSDKVKPKSYESTVSKYINSGDYKGLNDYMTRLVDKEVQDTYKTDTILSANMNVGQQRTDKLVGLIENNKDKIGAFDGYVSDFLQKFSNDKDYQQIKTILQMSQADARKYFAGSAVTETEMKALQDFIGGNTKMTPEGLVTMLQTLNDDRKMVYEQQRQGLELPNIKTVQAKKKLGGFSLTDILSKLK